MAVGSVTPFRPTETASLNAGTTPMAVPLRGAGDTVVVTNLSAALAYVCFGAGPFVSASETDMPIMANTRAVLLVNDLITYAGAKLVAGSGTVLFTRGDGSYV